MNATPSDPSDPSDPKTPAAATTSVPGAATNLNRLAGPRARSLADLAGQARGTFAFYVHHLDSGAEVTVRAGEPFPAASVIKLPIMLRLLEMVQQGQVALRHTVRLSAWHKTGGAGLFQFFHDGLQVTLEDACTAMIALSDNTATNLLIDVTGIAPVNDLLRRLGCARTRLHRYFGKPQMPGPAGPSQAVPAEIGRLLALLAQRQILTPALCDVAVTMLRRQTHRDLIPRFLPDGTPVAHKTGSLTGLRHDAGIIWLPAAAAPEHTEPDLMARPAGGFPAGSPLVFVGMSRDADERWTVDNEAHLVIARAARLAYDSFAGYSSSSSSSSSSPPVMASSRAK